MRNRAHLTLGPREQRIPSKKSSKNSRFLPKEMYNTKTGCAQTSVLIDLETDKEEFIFSSKQEVLKKNFWYYKDTFFDLLNK